MSAGMKFHRLCGVSTLIEREGLRATAADLAGLTDAERKAVADLLAQVERGLPAAALRRALEFGE